MNQYILNFEISKENIELLKIEEFLTFLDDSSNIHPIFTTLETHITFFVENIVHVCLIRPFNIENIIKIIYQFNEKTEFKSLFSDLLFFYGISQAPYLIFRLYKLNFYTKYFIQKSINLLLVKNIGFSTSKFYFPEIFGFTESDSNLFFKNIGISHDDLVQDDYKILFEILEFGVPKNSIEYYIKYDEVENLENILNEKQLTYDHEVFISQFEFLIKSETYPLIILSALYGSIKCFKACLLNHTKKIPNLIDSCLIGGNIDIVRLISTDNFNSISDNSFFETIKRRNFELFEWLKSNKEFKPFNNPVKSLFYYFNSIIRSDLNFVTPEISYFDFFSLNSSKFNIKIEKSMDLLVSSYNSLFYFLTLENIKNSIVLIEKGCNLKVFIENKNPFIISVESHFNKIIELLINKGDNYKILFNNVLIF